MIKINIEQGSEAWYQNKCGRITGTGFDDLIKKETTVAYRNLIYTVAGQIITGEIEESATAKVMERGKELEPEAVELYEEIYDCEVERVGFCLPDEDNEFHDYIGVSPDGIIGNVGLEVKCPLLKQHLYYMSKGVCPPEYYNQVQAGLFITGLESWQFMSFYPKLKPFIVKVDPDLGLFKKYEERLNGAIKEIKELIKIYNEYHLKQ